MNEDLKLFVEKYKSDKEEAVRHLIIFFRKQEAKEKGSARRILEQLVKLGAIEQTMIEDIVSLAENPQIEL